MSQLSSNSTSSNRRKKLLIWGPVVGGAAIVFGFVGLEVTMHPRFCGSCHSMKPYYKEWKHSTHQDVACVECHIEPGFKALVERKFMALKEGVVTLTGTQPPRPHSQVRDLVCLRPGCHSVDSINAGPVSYNGKEFYHELHLMEHESVGKLRCTSCHSQMVDGHHIAVNPDVCVLCHFKHTDMEDRLDGDVCMGCHKVPEEEVAVGMTGETFSHADYQGPDVRCAHCHADATHGTGRVLEVSCKACHKDPAKREHLSDHELLHEHHVKKHKVECYRCHTMIQHGARTGSALPKGGECARCHNQERHAAAFKIFQGIGGKGVDPSPGTKFRVGVDCIACHRGEDHQGGAQGCVACHGSDGASYLDDWKGELTSATHDVSRLLSQARRSAPDHEAIEVATHNLELVQDGRGVHNVWYALELLEHSKEQLNKALGKE